MTPRRIDQDGVRGTLETPDKHTGATNAIVLTHGAGSDSNSALLRSVSAKLCEAGWTVLRCDLPFRQQHSGSPRPAEAAGDREGLQQAVELLRKEAGKTARLFLGGQSYGGRQASMLMAEPGAASLNVKALLLMSYPLHPPGKPDKPRTAHLGAIHIPVFFAHGVRDPFGTREEMEAAQKLIPASSQIFLVDGVGHDLGSGKKLAFADKFLEFAAGV
jgi:uncharacterized protein